MLKPYLSLKVTTDDIDGESGFELVASNGLCVGHVVLWQSPDVFGSFAKELLSFPRDAQHQMIYQNKDSPEELLLRAFCISSSGRSALELRSAVQGPPAKAVSWAFSLVTEPASLNNLAQQLLVLSRGESKSLLWEPYAL